MIMLLYNKSRIVSTTFCCRFINLFYFLLILFSDLFFRFLPYKKCLFIRSGKNDFWMNFVKPFSLISFYTTRMHAINIYFLSQLPAGT
jgi:hypothetical protein